MENITENKLNNQNENSANEPILQLRMCRYRMHRVKRRSTMFLPIFIPIPLRLLWDRRAAEKVPSLRAINRMHDLILKIEYNLAIFT